MIFQKILTFLMLFLLSLISVSSADLTTAQHNLGNKDMAIDAGVKKVAWPKRKNIVKIIAPGELAQSDTEYVLKKDIIADGTAFVIKASHVTLNLNGHTITYLNGNSESQAYGVYVPGYNRKDIAIVNGKIIQGDGKCCGNVHGIGCNPIYNYDAHDIEIGGLEIVYGTSNTSGILLHWGYNANIHHNTIVDLGSKVTNRHQGIAAIEGCRGHGCSNQKIHHNLIKGARQLGIRAGVQSEVYNNEVHIDSSVTNSTGISAAGGSIHHNKIFGEGVHPIGIWPGNDIKVYSNYVEVQNTKRGDEYGDTGAACLRMTWGNDNVEVMNNTFILHAEENDKGTGVRSWGRAIWVGLPKPEQKAVFHDNIIVANNRDGKAKAAAIAIVCENESPNLIFRNNKVISNWSNVLLADSYGHAGGYARFIDNRFIRRGNHASYRTIRSQYSSRPSTGVFINNRFENGASPDDIDLEFNGSAVKELAFGWHLTVLVKEKGEAISNALVVIRDNTGSKVFEGNTDQQGKVAADLVAYLLTNQTTSDPFRKVFNKLGGKGSRISRTPHSIVVTKGERSIEKKVSLDGNADIEISF